MGTDQLLWHCPNPSGTRPLAGAPRMSGLARTAQLLSVSTESNQRVRPRLAVLGRLLSINTIICGTRRNGLLPAILMLLRQSSILLDCVFDQQLRRVQLGKRPEDPKPGVVLDPRAIAWPAVVKHSNLPTAETPSKVVRILERSSVEPRLGPTNGSRRGDCMALLRLPSGCVWVLAFGYFGQCQSN
jgi:hypothetical protein